MPNWIIRSKKTKEQLNIKRDPFFFENEAWQYIFMMGNVVSELYEPYYVGPGSAEVRRMINEGLVQHDLDNILLSKVSVDEYLPADAETENIVIAFFLKGVPEAVLPFKNFAEKFHGVMDVDYGDSDTIPNTSIVYVEFDRENYNIEDIDNLIRETTSLTEFEAEDYTVTFPHTNQKFPYKPGLLKRYFVSRDRRENYLAQKKAQRRAEREMQRDLAKQRAGRRPPEEQESRPQAVANESLARALGDLLFEDDLLK